MLRTAAFLRFVLTLPSPRACVRQHIQSVDELKGKAMAVRTHGQPHAVTLWLRMMGLENDVTTILVHDRDVGRWASAGHIGSCEVERQAIKPSGRNEWPRFAPFVE